MGGESGGRADGGVGQGRGPWGGEGGGGRRRLTWPRERREAVERCESPRCIGSPPRKPPLPASARPRTPPCEPPWWPPPWWGPPKWPAWWGPGPRREPGGPPWWPRCEGCEGRRFETGLTRPAAVPHATFPSGGFASPRAAAWRGGEEGRRGAVRGGPLERGAHGAGRGAAGAAGGARRGRRGRRRRGAAAAGRGGGGARGAGARLVLALLDEEPVLLQVRFDVLARRRVLAGAVHELRDRLGLGGVDAQLEHRRLELLVQLRAPHEPRLRRLDVVAAAKAEPRHRRVRRHRRQRAERAVARDAAEAHPAERAEADHAAAAAAHPPVPARRERAPEGVGDGAEAVAEAP